MSNVDGRVVIKIIADDKEAQQVIKTLDRIDKRVDGLGKSNGNVKNPFKGLNEGAEKSNSTIGNLTKSILASQLAMKALSVVSQSVGAAMSRFDTMQRFPKMMQQMGYSSEQSERSIKKLAKGIEGLPTRLDEVVATTQRLATMTGDLNKATDLTLALNNAFLASGSASADASRGLTQFQQMLANGKVDMQSWRTLQETMPIGLQKTAEAFGFAGQSAKSQFYEALKFGSITFDQFSDKLIELNRQTGGFADLAKTGSEGILTSFQNVRTAVVNGLAGIITKIDEVIRKATGKNIAQNLDSLKSVVKGLFNAVNSGIQIASPLIELAIKAFMKLWEIGVKLAPALEAVGVAFLTFKVLTSLGAGVSTMVGLMSKLMLGVQSAQKAFIALGATLTAHPIIAIISGISAALYGVYKWLTKIPDDIKDFTNEIDKNVEATKEMINASKESAENFRVTQEKTKLTSDTMRKLAEETLNLSDNTSRTAGQTKELKENIGELNRYLGDEIAFYDEKNKKMSVSKDVLEAYLAVAEKEANLEDTKIRLKQLDEEQFKINQQKLENAKQLEEAQKKLSDADWYQLGVKKELKEKIEELKTAEQDLSQSENLIASERTSRVETQKMQFEELAEAEKNLTQAKKEEVEKRIHSFDELNEYEKKVAEEMKSRYETIAQAATDMFDKINTESKLTHEEMLENLRHNVEAVAEWADNLASLADKGVNQGMLEQLRAMGPQGAGYVAELNKLSSEELEEFNRLFEQAGTQAPENMSKAMGVEKTRVRNGVFELITETENGLSEAIENVNWAKLGGNIVDGTREGIDSKQNEVKASVKQMSTSLMDVFTNDLGIHSPSTVFKGYALNIIQGLVQGFNSNKYSAISTARSVSSAIVSESSNEFNKAHSGAVYAGKMAGSGFAEGLEDRRWSVMSTARSIAAGVTGTIKSALRIHSPSRVMKDLGEFTGEGFEVGLESKLSSVKNLTKKLAESAIPKIQGGEVQRITNNNNGNMINNNSSNINIEKVEWSGKEDIKKTMEEIGWITGQEAWRLETI